MISPFSSLFSDPAWRLRSFAVCVIGGFWLLPGLLFRFEKTLMMPRVGGHDILFGFVSELAIWCIGTAFFMLLAAAPGRLGVLWWPVFALGSASYYVLSVAEHCYVEHTGMRMHFRTVKYGVFNFEELRLIIHRVIGPVFYWRMALALGVLLLAWLVFWIFRHRSELLSPRLPWIFLVFGLILLILPKPASLQDSGLAGAMAVELVKPAPDLEKLYASIPEAIIDQVPSYVKPTVVDKMDTADGADGADGADSADEIDTRLSTAPNVVLVILESTGAAMVPPYSDPQVWEQLPAMASLARESVIFEPVYSSVTHTSKALVGILCGTFPRPILDIREAVAGWPWPLECLPGLLESAGYRTAFMQSAEQVFENRMVLVRNMGFTTAAFQETLYREPYQKLGYFSMEDRAMVDPALQWAQKGGEKPFFLTLLTSAAHHPYDVPGFPVNRDPSRFPAYYREALKQQDRFLGELMDGLENAGLKDDTILIVIGDHGEAFGEHVGMQHNWVPYEEVVRVPLLMRGPRVGAVRRIEGLRHHVDLMPTLLNLLDVPWQGVLPGRDLFSSTPHERVWSSCWGSRTCLSLREGDVKVAYHFGFRPTQVFDLSTDPLELNNLASSMPEPEIRRLEQTLLAHLRATDRFWAANDEEILGN